MNTSTFHNVIKNQGEIEKTQTAELNSIISEFPYFQAARVMHLKSLKQQESFKYNKELKLTAAHTLDRSILFNFITSKEFQKHKKNEILIEEANIKNEQKPEVEKIKKELSIGAPISFKASENYSFNQWLQLSVQDPVKTEKNDDISKKEQIINKFIETSPKIKPLSKDKVSTTADPSIQEDSYLMTETLAKVYLEQKKYENAIKAYRILSLKYPEKSGFFADQIKKIEILQKHKS